MASGLLPRTGLTGVVDKLRGLSGPHAGQTPNALGGLHNSQRVLLALVEAGNSREDSYRMVQRNAMKTWGGEGPLLELLQKDEDVMAKLTKEQLEDLFDLDYHFKQVDTIFERVFGRS